MRDDLTYEQWHRRLSSVTSWLTVSGDLDPHRRRGTAQLAEWDEARITDIVDVRCEWSDEDRVAEHFPRHALLAPPDPRQRRRTGRCLVRGPPGRCTVRPRSSGESVLVNSHMGVIRAPSMALRLLLDRDWDTVEALASIRTARPIAAAAYAHDTVAHHHRSIDSIRRPTPRLATLAGSATRWSHVPGASPVPCSRRATVPRWSEV